MSTARNYQTALTAAAKAYEAGDTAAIETADLAACNAEAAFDNAGLSSQDFPGVQAAEKRYHTARTAYDNARTNPIPRGRYSR